MKNNSFWSNAAKDGLIMGLLLCVVLVLGWLFRLEIEHSTVSSLLSFCVIGYCVFTFAKRRAEQYGKEGFTYSQSFGYIMAMALFAGFVLGGGYYLMNNFVAREYYQEIFNIGIEQARTQFEDEGLDDAVNMARQLMTSPVVVVISSVLNILIYSCFIGIIASVFIKRAPEQEYFNEKKDDE